MQTLAYGQQRLVEMAMTLALRPRMLILDEPAAGVPSDESHLIAEAIARLPERNGGADYRARHGAGVSRCAPIIVLVGGAILTEGPPEAISRDPRVRDLYLGQRHG